jgi:PTS system fructose-specific IIC component
MHVEMQGSSGSTPLSAETIAADAVIFATDVGVKDRQVRGKPGRIRRQAAINEPAKMVAGRRRNDPNAARVEGVAAHRHRVRPRPGGVGRGTAVILPPASAIAIPFVAAGGLSDGFLFAGTTSQQA